MQSSVRPNQRLHPAPRQGAGVGHLVNNSVGWTFSNQQSLAARVSREPLGGTRHAVPLWLYQFLQGSLTMIRRKKCQRIPVLWVVF
jgi:hypothetical protein